jgi:hypothetical protein
MGRKAEQRDGARSRKNCASRYGAAHPKAAEGFKKATEFVRAGERRRQHDLVGRLRWMLTSSVLNVWLGPTSRRTLLDP